MRSGPAGRPRGDPTRPSTRLLQSRRTNENGAFGVFLGDDLLAWLTLAIGGALAVGTLLALVRPPADPGETDLVRPPLARSVAMIVLGSVAALWGVASLLR